MKGVETFLTVSSDARFQERLHIVLEHVHLAVTLRARTTSDLVQAAQVQTVSCRLISIDAGANQLPAFSKTGFGTRQLEVVDVHHKEQFQACVPEATPPRRNVLEAY